MQKTATPSGSGKPRQDEILTESEASKILKLSPRTLQAWRVSGNGPRFHSLGRAVRYRRADLDDWLASRSRTSTSQQIA
ncbi:MAG TPA: helix-turn-helix domain-containing protein [Rhodomicrobium sp.]|nr:helix-turn-helix domain-containing protein [Rhodomicrobium sp.]